MRLKEISPRPAVHFLRPGELKGSYTNDQLIKLGFRKAINGTWYMSQAKWNKLLQQGILKENTTLTERISSIVYHYTLLKSAYEILTQGKFELSSTVGTPWEHQLSPRQKYYFLSTTRTLLGGFRGSRNLSVIFEINGDWINQRYSGHAVDYYNNRNPKYNKPHEAEDRILSNQHFIPIDCVKSVHILVEPINNKRVQSLVRKMLIVAKKRNIPAYAYDIRENWQRLDTSTSISVSLLKGKNLDTINLYDHRGNLMRWLEIFFGTDIKKLSKNAYSLLMLLLYGNSNLDKELANDLHNARSPAAGVDRKNAIKIINLLKKYNFKDLSSLLDWTKSRWSK